MRKIVILGSTGSIGQSALDIIDRHPGVFRIIGLAAHSNHRLLAEQIKRYDPSFAIIGDKAGLAFLRGAFRGSRLEILEQDGIEQLCRESDIDIVLNAIVGIAGLQATAAALGAGKIVALANKESMVAAGPILNHLAIEYGGKIIPIDSEHSAVFQSLAAGKKNEVARIILTGSGGPFLRRADLAKVTLEEALAHPTWKMGPKITIDSATLMNKALEIIEAAYLFDLPPDKIEVVMHPQSIIHSMVEYIDGSTIAQMSRPDMRLPIQYALFYPQRQPLDVCRLDLTTPQNLEFLPPDRRKFRSLDFAYHALERGGAMPAILNAANEAAVKAFLERRIGFLKIYEIIERTMEETGPTAAETLEDITRVERPAVLALAAFVGKTRLIDNVVVGPGDTPAAQPRQRR